MAHPDHGAGPARPGRYRRLLAGVLMVLAVTASVVLWWGVRGGEVDEAERADARVAESSAAVMEETIERVMAGLRGAPALVEENGRIDPRRFSVYAQDLVDEGEITSLFVETVLQADERGDWERGTNLEVRDRAPSGEFVRAPERSSYCPIVQIEPATPANQAIRGFDVCAEPVRGATTARAARTGDVEVSAPLQGAVSGRPAVFITRAIYGPADGTPQGAEPVGYVSLGLQAERFGAAAVEQLPGDAELRLTAGDTVLLGPSEAIDGQSATMDVPGQTWVVVAADGRAASHTGSWLLLAGGLAFTGLLVAFLVRAASDERALSLRARLAAVSAEVAAATSGARTVAGVAESALAVVTRHAGASEGYVGLVDPARGTINRIATVGGAPMAPGRAVDVAGHPALERAVGTGEVVLSDRSGRAVSVPSLAVPSGPSEPVVAAVVPVALAEGRLGVLHLAYDQPRPFDDQDVRELRLVAATLATALDRATVDESERQVAQALQRSLLRVRPDTEGAAVHVRYVPASAPLVVGGDWYDLLRGPDGSLVAVVGDAVGHGVDAAAAMAQLRSALRASVLRTDDPAGALAVLDEFVATAPEAECATVACLAVDTDQGQVRYSVAGHPPPVVVSPTGEVALLEGSRAWPLLANLGRERPAPAVAAFPPGSLVVLYTDGLVERRSESIDTGIERLRRSVAAHWNEPLPVLSDSVLTDLIGGGDAVDDTALLCLRTSTVSADLLVHVFRADPALLSQARRELRTWLAATGCSEAEADDLLLATSEALSNAVEHGSRFDANRTVTLEASVVGERVVVAVSDTGRWRPGDPGADPALSDRGRGLPMMRDLSEDLDIRMGDQGTTVVLTAVVGT